MSKCFATLFAMSLVGSAFICLPTMTLAQTAQPTSTKRLAADPRASYRAIKSIMQNDLLVKWPTPSNCSPETPKEITIMCCAGSYQFYVMGPIERALTDLAYEILLTRSAMSASNVPDQYWEPSSSQYEESALRAIENKRYFIYNKYEPEFSYIELEGISFSNLAKEINSALRSAKMDLTVKKGECGRSAKELEIRTAPAGGIVHLLPKLFYLLCKRQGDDVDDEKTCDHWLPPIHAPEIAHVGGVYRYWIEWPNKRSSSSEFDSDRDFVPRGQVTLQ